MKEWIKRLLQRVTKAVRQIFAPAYLAADSGTVLLIETPTQILTRKLTAIALGSLAIFFLTMPTSFVFDELVAYKFGDWLARTANTLWNYNPSW